MKIYKKIAIAILLIIFVLYPNLNANAENKNILLDIISNLSKTNPEILAEKASVNKAKEEINLVKSNLYPNITARATASSFVTEPSSFGSSNGEQADLNLTIKQPLYKGGRTSAKIKETELLLKANIAKLQIIEQNIFLEALATYIDLIKNTKIVKLREKNVDTLNKQLEYEEARQRLGENTITDLTQAKSRLAESKAKLAAANGELLNNVAKYKRLLGYNAKYMEKLEIPKLNISSLMINDLQALIKLAIKNNPSIRLLELQEKANLANQKFIKGELYPSLDLIGQTKRYYKPVFAPTEPFQDQSNITIQASIPLYSGGSVRTKLKKSKYERQNIVMQLNNAKREIEENLITALQNIKTANAEIDARKAQLETSIIALKGVKEEFSLGNRTTLDVLNAEEEKLNSEVNLTLAKRKLAVAQLFLINTVGMLSVEDFSKFLDK